MAVPIDPTVEVLVTQALKRAGRTTPSATQIQEASDHALQEVKADIMLLAPTHPSLMTTSTTITTRGQQRYAIPLDANEHISIMLLDGPNDWRGTAQAGGATSITLASTVTSTADEVVGKYVIITSGPGVEEYREIIDYSPSTHIATVDLAWLSTPTSGSTYLVISESTPLWPQDTATEFDQNTGATTLGTPTVASLFAQEFLLYPVPDLSTYGLLSRYFADLSSLDESDPLFIQLLREWRSIWVQGIAVKSMQRFDEDRYQSELAVYKAMLDFLATQTCTVTQIRAFDV
jgi:hypothetical protein